MLIGRQEKLERKLVLQIIIMMIGIMMMKWELNQKIIKTKERNTVESNHLVLKRRFPVSVPPLPTY